MSKEFSIDDAEEVIADFQNITDGEFSSLAAALRDLAKVPPLPQFEVPPLVPSKVRVSTLPTQHVRRAGIATTMVIGILSAAAVGAAALVGVPPPLVNFAKNSVDVVQKAITKIADVVTGNETPDDSEPSIESFDDKITEKDEGGSPNGKTGEAGNGETGESPEASSPTLSNANENVKGEERESPEPTTSPSESGD